MNKEMNHRSILIQKYNSTVMHLAKNPIYGKVLYLLISIKDNLKELRFTLRRWAFVLHIM